MYRDPSDEVFLARHGLTHYFADEPPHGLFRHVPDVSLVFLMGCPADPGPLPPADCGCHCWWTQRNGTPWADRFARNCAVINAIPYTLVATRIEPADWKKLIRYGPVPSVRASLERLKARYLSWMVQGGISTPVG